MPITIGAGFHFLGPTGEMVAPEIYFADASNPNGEIYQTEEAQTCRTGERFRSDAIQVEAVLARETALPPGACAGNTTELALVGFSFTRAGDVGREVDGQLDPRRILTVGATFAPNGTATIRTAFSSECFSFRGSDAADVFHPNSGLLPVSSAGDIRSMGGNDILVAQAGTGRVFGGAGADMFVFSSGADSSSILTLCQT